MRTHLSNADHSIIDYGADPLNMRAQLSRSTSWPMFLGLSCSRLLLPRWLIVIDEHLIEQASAGLEVFS
jgi:hypothetical protein